MTTVPGSLSGKIPSREKILSAFVNEIKPFLLACALLVLGQEVFLQSAEGASEWPRETFAALTLLFFLLFSLLEHFFGMIGEGGSARYLWLFPAALLFVLLTGRGTWPHTSAAVAVAALLRLLNGFIFRQEKVVLCLPFFLDAAALGLFVSAQVLSGGFLTDKILFISLTVLTLASVQKLVTERAGKGFPFLYFALLAALLFLMPMREEPIAWTPVIEAGGKVADAVMDALDYISYHMSSVLHTDSPEAGYSSFDMSGESVGGSERIQLELATEELPYFLYTDAETGRRMKVRRTLYLTGGAGVDKAQLVRFLHFLHGSGVDRETAALFSRVSYVDVTYAYLDTFDEIIPANALVMTAGEEKIESGRSSTKHRRGYEIRAAYLEIDYGSPYLIELIRVAGKKLSGDENENQAVLSYEDISDYAVQLYGLGFRKIMSAGEYEKILEAGFLEDFSMEVYLKSGSREDELMKDGFQVDGYLKSGSRDDEAGEDGFQVDGYLKSGSRDDEAGEDGFQVDGYLKSGSREGEAREDESLSKGIQGNHDPLEEKTASSHREAGGSTDRLADLAAQVTAGCEGDYDKCRAIEAYLRQFSYSTHTAGGHDPASDMTTPEGMADIADRFLFETQEGYCVHYTSAMVMLLRLAGIPARAVSGYRYEFPFEVQETYPVSSTCAHTWPEAFLPGIGWVPFEPTSSHGTSAEFTWHRQRPSEDSAATGQSEFDGPIPTPDPVPDNESEEEISTFARILPSLPIILSVLLSVILLALLAAGGSVLIAKIRYMRSTPVRRLEADVEEILQQLRKKASGPIPDRGLLTDYISTAPEELREDLGRVFQVYYRIRYGDRDSTIVHENEIRLARELRDRLRERRHSRKRANSDGHLR